MTSQARLSILEGLENDSFDVAIVGAGITGAWIALYCSSLGLNTALLERGDFAGETSAASSKLLHGGIRYLQQLQLKKVRESTLERAAYLRAAPHLSSPVPFLVPTYKDIKRSKFLLRSGVAAYNFLGIGQYSIADNLADHDLSPTSLSAAQLNEICDIRHLEHTGAVAFPEFHMHDSERTVWAVVDSARKVGATVANYINVDEFNIDDKTVTGLTVTDRESDNKFSVSAKLTINAAGPWVDTLNSKVRLANDASHTSPLIQNYAAGAHVITRQITGEHAIAISTNQKSVAAIDRGGRHIFIIPWRGQSLIGTSYRETEDPDSTETLSRLDLHQLLDAVNETIPNARLDANDIVSAYIGLYPLRTDKVLSDTYQGSGEYMILDHSRVDNIDGVITSLGAKFTTGRVLAEKTVNLAKSKLELALPDTNKAIGSRLYSANYTDLTSYIETQSKAYINDFTKTQIEHFVHCFGSQTGAFIEYINRQNNPERMKTILIHGQPDILGQVSWAIDKEMALHLNDVLLRRTSVGLLGITKDALHQVANLMKEKLGWPQKQLELEIDQFTTRQNEILHTAKEYYGGA